jgi:hypothetical protein
MPRIGDHGHARVVDLLAQLVATALLRQEAAAFIGRARTEEVHHEADQACRCGRLQDHRVLARFQRLGFGRLGGLAHGDADVLVGLEVAASFRLRPTQPEPRPSSVRTVQV